MKVNEMMDYYKYYIRNDHGNIIACVGILVDRNVPSGSRYNYYRLISLPNPKEKLNKRELSKYNYETLINYYNNNSDDEQFTLFGGVLDSLMNVKFYWEINHGMFLNDDFTYKFKKNVSLYNHEYRMITPPLDQR